MTDGWHYAEGGKAVGPLDSKEMQVILSKISDPRNLQVWKVGFKGWERAGNVPGLAGFIHEPPPLPREPPPLPQITHRRSQGIWRSVVAVSIAVAAQWAFLIDATLLAQPLPFVIGRLLGLLLGALMILIALDWATRRRRQFAQRLRRTSSIG